MSNTGIIGEKISRELYNQVVSVIFPNLILDDKMLLLNGLCMTIATFAISFNLLNDMDTLFQKLRLNNYRDCVGLLFLLLPFIKQDTESSSINLLNLTKLYTEKTTYDDISKNSPKYKYSNIQYNRCKRNPLTEIDFSKTHFFNNLEILLNTIKYMGNKLYVNWIDVLPITFIQLKKTNLYIITTKNILEHNIIDWDPFKINKMNKKEINNCSSLYVGNIYEILVNEFYEGIKNIKWTIYDIFVNQGSYSVETAPGKIENIIPAFGYYPMILILNKILDLDIMLKDDEYISLKDIDRNNFEKKWKQLIGAINNNSNIFFAGSYNLTSVNVRKLAKSLCVFFDKYYDNIDDAIDDGYIKLGSEDIDEDNEDDDELNKLKISDVIKSVESIKPSHIYSYILDCVKKLKNTFYGTKLINKKENKFAPDDILIYDQVSIKIENKSHVLSITYKNLYNYCKSLCHFIVGNMYIEYPKFWRSLDETTKDNILKRLNTNSSKDSMSWFNISNYILSTYPESKNYVQIYNKTIHDCIQENLPTFIFQSMIYRGVLSKFNLETTLSNDLIMGSDKDKLIPTFLKKTIFQEKSIYKSDCYYYLTGDEYGNMLNSAEKGHWFDYNSQKNWYTAYALNWVAQISFFHHYLNNRVIYVTGSTGVGKSTQVPKLLLYGLKAIDYKNNGTVICSQPRKAPTMKNAKRIAEEMGVPIELDNYSIQYEHKDAAHVKKINGLVLKIVTDGLLIKDTSNSLLKVISKKNNYFLKNLYDIVIVDEAHEHNTNMDLILTYMKHSLYYNNDIKLVIISATMDDDEPIYRRYYRDINDNRMFPLNYELKEKKLDRINVDRRFHISPPGQTTKFKIEDIYVPNRNALDVAVEIAKTSSTGDILLFEPGVKDISDAINELNSQIPINMIAIPYHSRLPDAIREFVEDIDKNKKKLNLTKQDFFDDINVITTGKETNKYDRVLIVATNIAEASITIDGLKYVVETGTQKTSIYDYKIGGTALKLTPVSESSRLQRRGRLGRTAPGTVYYMYKKGAMEDIVQQYHITIENLYLPLFSLLIEGSPDPLFTEKNDPNKNKIEYTNTKQMFKYGIDKIIQRQYFIGHEFFDYYGNDTQYDYANVSRPIDNYNSKYTKKTLDDGNGLFYIIHPEENIIQRNIIGQIVGSKDKDIMFDPDKKTINSHKMKLFWQTLVDINLLDNNFNKTEYGKMLYKLFNLPAYSENFEQLVTFVYSMAYGCEEEISRVMSFYGACKGKIKEIAQGIMVKNRYRDKTESIQKIFGGDSHSDIETILNIVDVFHKYLEKRVDINYLKIKTIVFDKINKNYTQELVDEELKKLILKGTLKNTGNPDDKEYDKVLRTNYVDNLLVTNMNNYKQGIETICNKVNLKSKIILDYFKNYFTFQKNRYVLKNNPPKDIDLPALLSQIQIKNIYKNNPVTACLLHGYPFNTAKKMGHSKAYLSTCRPNIENIYTLPTISKYYSKEVTIADTKYLQNYILYLELSLEDKTLNFAIKISPAELKELYNIYGHKYSAEVLPYMMAKKIKMEGNLDTQSKVIHLYTATLDELKELCNFDQPIIISHDTQIIPYDILNQFK